MFQLQILSFLGAIVFWTYSGCLISFFTFSDSGPPIHSLSELTKKPYIRLETIGKGTTYLSIQNWLEKNYGTQGLEAFNKAILLPSNDTMNYETLSTLIKKMVENEPKNYFGLVSESQSITGQLKRCKYKYILLSFKSGANYL